MKALFGARSFVTKACAATVLIVLICLPGYGQVSVLTQKNDNQRTGQNLSETVLTTSNVNSTAFGRLFNIPVDGCLYAQPLYVPNVSIGGGTHNVIYLATAHDSVYACDADTGTQYWKVSLGAPVPSSVINTPNIPIEVGIIGTPAIDTSTNTLYVDAKTYLNSVQTHKLHALDTTTGAEKFGGPVVIAANVSGTGEASVNGVVPFQASQENQRPGITLANGNVYVAFASHEDFEPYHGWILSYNKSTLQQNAVFNDTPDGIMGGIWMAGQGLVVDSAGNLYAMTGNGSSDVQSGGRDYSECFLKLSPTLSVLDWFMPSDEASLNASDADLGSAGPMMIPGTSDLVGGGKEGILYLVNSGNMGHFNASTDNVLQEWQAINTSLAGSHHIHCAPVYYNNNIYVWGENDFLRQFAFNGSSFNTTAVATGVDLSPASNAGMPGGMLSVSANGTTAGTGIVWATTPWNADSLHAEVSGVFRAYDASNVSHELWNSRQNVARDDVGLFAKDTSPTVANGKVYLATFSGNLGVYGLIANSACPATTTAPTGLSASGTNSTSTNLNWTAVAPPSGCSINSYTVYENGMALDVTHNASYTVTGLAGSTTYTFTVAATDARGASSQSSPVTITTSPAGSAPFVNGTYRIISENSGLAVDDLNAGGVGTGVDQQPYSAANQQWNLTVVSGMQYKITNAATGLAVTGTTLGAQLTMQTYTGATNQLWTFGQSGGYYIITNVSSGQVVDDFGASLSAGAVIGQFGANGGTNQAWSVTPVSIGSCSASPGSPTGLAASGTTSTGTTLNWTAVTPPSGCTISNYTVFKNGTSIGATGATSLAVTGLSAGVTYAFTVAATDTFGTSAQSTPVSVTTTAGAPPFANGTYKIVSAVGGLAVDDLNGGGAGTGTDQQPYSGTNQNWTFTIVSGSQYKITSAANGLAITGTTLSAQLTLQTYTGATNQLWTFAPSGAFYIATNVSSGQVLDNFGNSTTAGTVVGQWVTNGGANQTWTITAVTGGTCAASPTAPLGLGASGTTTTTTNLTWGAVTPPANCSITSYTIFKNGTSIGTSATNSFVVTGLSASTTYVFTVSTADSFGSSAQSTAVNVTTPSAGGIQIACGNSAQGTFVADTDFSGGAVSSGTTTTINTSAVTNPAPMSVWQHGRKSNFTYTIPGFAAGSSHTVKLDFCEYAANGAGQRTFNVLINGAQVLTNFDIFATAGAEFKATQKTFTATANGSGQVVIQFVTVVNNALVAGIEVQ